QRTHLDQRARAHAVRRAELRQPAHLVGEQRLAQLALVQVRERLRTLRRLQRAAGQSVDDLFSQAMAVEGVEGWGALLQGDYSSATACSLAVPRRKRSELRSSAVTLRSS